MIVFPLYAILVWLIVWRLPARWMRLLFLPLALLPVGVIASLCVHMLPLPDHEPRPVWLMSIAWAYAALIGAVSLLITFAKPKPDDLCHACGYDLSGNELGICPECGTVARCRSCHKPLVHTDFGPCPHCKEPFPRFAPIEHEREREEPRTPRDRAAIMQRYIAHTRAQPGAQPNSSP